MVKPLKNQGGVLLSTCSVTGTMLGPTGDSKGVATLLCRGTYRLTAQVNQHGLSELRGRSCQQRGAGLGWATDGKDREGQEEAIPGRVRPGTGGLRGKASLPFSLLPPFVPVLAEASVRGLEDRKLWQVGREGAMLKCLSEGQPPPSYNWTR